MRKFFFALALLPLVAAEVAEAQYPKITGTELTRVNSQFAGGAATYSWPARATRAHASRVVGYRIHVRTSAENWGGSIYEQRLTAGVVSSASPSSGLIDKDATYTVLNGLQAGVTHAARIIALVDQDFVDPGDWSDAATVFIPPAPQNLRASLSGATLNLSWDALPGAGTYRYRVATSQQNWVNAGGALGVETTATSVALRVAAGRSYHAAVAAVTGADSLGIGGWSAPVSSVGRALSTDTTLKNLQLTDTTGVAFTTPFDTAFDADPAVTSVSTLAADTAVFRVRAQAVHAGAQVSVRVEQVGQRTQIVILPLTPLGGDHLSPLITQPADKVFRILITVTAEDGFSQAVYRHTRAHPPKTDATLRSLRFFKTTGGRPEILTATVRPPFVASDPAFTEYEVEFPTEFFAGIAVQIGTTEMDARMFGDPGEEKSDAVRALRKAPFTIDGASVSHARPEPSVTTTTDLVLTAATPTVLLATILAPDDVTQLVYQFTLTRLSNTGSGVNTLTDLSVQAGGATLALDQTFAAATRTYAAGSTTAESVTLTPVTTHAAASIFVDGEPVNSGSASGAIALQENTPKRISVTVQAENGARTEYFVTVTRAATPEAPAGVTAGAAKGGARLAWEEAAGALSYRVRWRLSDADGAGGNADPGAWQDANGDDAECADDNAATDALCGIATSARTSHHLTGLTDGVQYDIAVGAANAQGVGWSGDTALQVTPRAVTDARLLSLGVTSTPPGAKLSPAFSPDVGEYEIVFARDGLTSLAYAHTAATGASVAITGTNAADNAQAVLLVGETPVVFTVTAEDASTVKTYSVRQKLYPPITAFAIADANDQAVQVLPQFAAHTFAYEGGEYGAVANATAEVAVTAAFSGTDAANIGARGQGTRPALQSGAASTVALREGRNDIDITFQSAGAASPLLYTVTIYRELRNAAPPEAPRNVAAGVASTALNLSWEAPGNDGGSAVTGYKVRHKVAGADANTFTESTAGGGAHTISSLTNRELYDVEVAAVSLAGTGAYAAVQARPAADDDAGLAALALANASLSPAFAVDTLMYTAEVAYTAVRDTFTATPMHARAGVDGDGARDFAVGANTFAVTVTAVDTVATQNYSAVVTRAPPGISGFTLHGAALTPDFAAGTFSYLADAAQGAPQFTFAMTVTAGAAAELRRAADGSVLATLSGADEFALDIARGVTEYILRYTEGGVSSDYRFTARRGLRPPSPPRDFLAGVADTALNLRWQPPADSGGTDVAIGALSYELRWRADSAADFAAGDARNFAPGDARTHQLTGLANDSKYILQVRARNDEHAGAWAEAFGMPGTFHIALEPDRPEFRWQLAVIIARVMNGARTTEDVLCNFDNGCQTVVLPGVGNVNSFGLDDKIAANLDRLDVDAADGTTIHDAILIARYLLGVRGGSLTAGITGADSATVAKTIGALLP